MANPERGEVEIVVGQVPKERRYTLTLSTNAAATLEAKHNKSVGELLAEAATLRFTAIRGMVWMLLQRHHADEFKTEFQVGDLIDKAGGVAVFFGKLQELANVNAPEPPLKEGSGNPPDAPADGGDGPGASSTTTLAGSA